jgi:hypothetical protein
MAKNRAGNRAAVARYWPESGHQTEIAPRIPPEWRDSWRRHSSEEKPMNITESVVEDAALAWLEALGYAVLHGPDIAAGEPGAERTDPNYRDVLLERRVRQALVRLNPDLPPDALDDAYRKLTRADAPSLVERNRAVHRMLVDGVTVEYRRKDDSIAGALARPSLHYFGICG